ncbi:MULTISPECIES: hypothetical protein [unclassified Halomonas]|uniref:hypothetical protein n=1 Tax=unclassified Halomonas TaxID=2609666 RepID=UPI0005F9C7E7|nr:MULTISPECIES: hypothetical protein [unclassified Halomonas]KJZ14573.1 hypothetical protein TW86_10040 [Halomonas sp. S2151]MCO7216414.1 hypothetical protein [Halomonas sp. OfavH-34-E]
MNHQEYVALQAERNALQAMLDKIPEDRVLDRASLEIRLEEVAELLAETTLPERELTKAVLTFNGRPVAGSEGVLADFATKALAAFSEAITAVGASLHATLAPTGPVPNRQQYQMMITGTARGSFGFQLEESTTQLELDEDSTVALALEATRSLLDGSVGVDDEQLAEAAADMDQRALDKIRSFVSVLNDNEAVCTLMHAKKSFRFKDASQVKRSLERLSTEYLSENEKVISVKFGGALPHKGSCEFQIEGNKEWLTAKIGPGVESPDIINDHRGEKVEAKMLVTQAGRGRPRYKLLELPAWSSHQTLD